MRCLGTSEWREAALLCVCLGFFFFAQGDYPCPGGCSCLEERVRCTLLNLEYVPDGIPENAAVLDLRFNAIKYLQPGPLEHLRRLNALHLDANPLTCDCGALRMVELVIGRNSSALVTGTCGSPEAISGATLRDLLLFRKPPPCQPPAILREPEDVEAIAGDTIAFRCKASGDPEPLVTWMHNGSEVVPAATERHSVLDDGSLLISDLREEDVGAYECVASSSEGTVRSRSAHVSIYDPNESANTTSPPFVVDPPLDQKVLRGDAVSISCAVKGDPHPDISWVKDGQLLEASERHKVRRGEGEEGLCRKAAVDSVQVSPEGTLTMEEVDAADAGVYTCSAANFLGRADSSMVLTVLAPPAFRKAPENREALVGATAELVCEAEGYPPPAVRWRRINRALVLEKRIKSFKDGTHLLIQNSRESDSGVYVCEAYNGVGTDSSSVELTVHESSRPWIVETTAAVSAPAHTTVLLRCSAIGFPKPAISWTRRGQLLSDDGAKIRIGPDGVLTLSDLQETDEGTYECTAHNNAGFDLAPTSVTMKSGGGGGGGGPLGTDVLAASVDEARSQVDRAVEGTLSRRDQDEGSSPPSRRLLQLFRFPKAETRELARAEEIYERALEILGRHVNTGSEFNLTGSDYKDLLPPAHLQLIADLSGCLAPQASPECEGLEQEKYRTFDGTCNNREHPTWGAALTAFKRLLSPIYENGFNHPVGWNPKTLYRGFPKPNARRVSMTTISSSNSTPDGSLSHMVMQWGQFLDHDMDFSSPSISSETFRDGIDCSRLCKNVAPCFPIEMPDIDPRHKDQPCMEFTRSSAICGSGMTSIFLNELRPREQLNQLTSYIDGSQIYGSSEFESQALRDATGKGRGLLRGKPADALHKEMLPSNDGVPVDCKRNLRESTMDCFLAGDVRANEQLGLLTMHTVWFREHNRIARELSRLNAHWTSGAVFQEARKIVGAMLQHITYAEWLPKILGARGMRELGPYLGYDPGVDASVSNAFATAAMRFGHSLISPVLARLDSAFKSISEGDVPLRKAFFAPWRLVVEGGPDPVLRGLFATSAKSRRGQGVLNSELTDHLFEEAHVIALDLAAINIQRGRDHGLPGYVQWRRFCNLSVPDSFEEIRKRSANPSAWEALEELYGHPENLDLWVGGVVEDQDDDARVSDTLRCILVDQFRRARDGDRFWYENDGVFTEAQLSQIRRSSLARVLCDSGDDIREVSFDVFLLPTPGGNPIVSCERIAVVDLTQWKEAEPLDAPT